MRSPKKTGEVFPGTSTKAMIYTPRKRCTCVVDASEQPTFEQKLQKAAPAPTSGQARMLAAKRVNCKLEMHTYTPE
eukprot:511181-Pleurochrysis_carterae.AAC.1